MSPIEWMLMNTECNTGEEKYIKLRQHNRRYLYFIIHLTKKRSIGWWKNVFLNIMGFNVDNGSCKTMSKKNIEFFKYFVLVKTRIFWKEFIMMSIFWYSIVDYLFSHLDRIHKVFIFQSKHLLLILLYIFLLVLWILQFDQYIIIFDFKWNERLGWLWLLIDYSTNGIR